MRPQRENRRGAALLFVVGCVALLAIVFGALMRLGFVERGQARSEERRVRAAWLAESGLERAWSKLSADSDYRGEPWELPAETLKGRDAALVQITIEPIENQQGRVRVTSRADYPRDSTTRARQTRTAVFSIPTKSKASSTGETK